MCLAKSCLLCLFLCNKFLRWLYLGVYFRVKSSSPVRSLLGNSILTLGKSSAKQCDAVQFLRYISLEIGTLQWLLFCSSSTMQPKVGSLNTNRWDKSRAFQSIQWKTNSWNLEPRKTKGRTVVLFGGSSNFLFFSLFLISLLFFARKASFTRILSLDLKVSLIVPFLPSGLKDLQSVTLGNSLQSFPHITRKLTIVRLLVSNRST